MKDHEGAGPGNPAEILADRFLEAMGRRDFAAAETFLAPGFTMTFPGGRRFTRLAELSEFAQSRYRFVRKRIEAFETVPGEGAQQVWVLGTLEGEWPDGTPFDGIRFVDRFTVRGDRLVEQRVWNDLAEFRR